ncbi:hypothetical protein EYF80_054512 [Liparis tanakae]|uniref:Uncharacterized protein n=1 Tax=Liparis tanakae TaxID=230148 RepID=A0A4Z2F352_9TELE|nr:hypothetical protein EYF80_054512 [Liparis tanakae]
MVGIVVTTSPSLSLYRMVVFPAASRPTIRILISFLPNKPLNMLVKPPISARLQEEEPRREPAPFGCVLHTAGHDKPGHVVHRRQRTARPPPHGASTLIIYRCHDQGNPVGTCGDTYVGVGRYSTSMHLGRPVFVFTSAGEAA